MKFFFDYGCVFVVVDNDRVLFTEIGRTVLVVVGTGGNFVNAVNELSGFRVCSRFSDPIGHSIIILIYIDDSITGAAVNRKVQLAVFGADCRIILASVFVIIIGINSIDRAAGNTNCRVAATTAIGIADGGRIGRTNGCHIGIIRNCDRKISAMAILAGTDCRCCIFALGMDRGVAGDRDGRIAPSPRTAIADGGTKFAIGIDNGVSGNSDIVALGTAANACTAISACRDVSIAFNADVFCVTVGAAADARTILITAAGSDFAALNCNIGSIG